MNIALQRRITALEKQVAELLKRVEALEAPPEKVRKKSYGKN